MLPERYRRLWHRRLRRRPLLPFLLTATVAVDLALLGLVGESPLVTGFVSGQIALLAIWTTWSPTRIVLRAFVALGAVLVGLAVTQTLAVGPPPDEAARHADVDWRPEATAVVLASLAGNTAAAAAVHALVRRRRRGLRSRRKRFGIAALLWATATTAVILGFGHNANWGVLAVVLVFVLVLAEALLTALVLFAQQAIRSKSLKLGLLVWFPVGIALLGFWQEAAHFFTYYAAQIAMIGGWLVAIESMQRPAIEPTRIEPTPVPEPAPEPIDLRA